MKDQVRTGVESCQGPLDALYNRRCMQEGWTVTVIFFADLRRFIPRGEDGPQRYTVHEGAAVADLLAAIGIEQDAEVTVAVDGELASRDTPLRDGAEVMLLNPMEGGQ